MVTEWYGIDQFRYDKFLMVSIYSCVHVFDMLSLL